MKTLNSNPSRILAWMVPAALLGALFTGTPSLAAEPNVDQVEALKKQIEALTEKVRSLEQWYELDRKTNGTKGAQPAALPPSTNAPPTRPADPAPDPLDHAAAAERAKATPTVSLDWSGLKVRSGDSNFLFDLGGYLQVVGQFGVGETSETFNDGFEIRRARIDFEGTVYKIFDYRVMLDFGSDQSSTEANDGFLQDAYLNARFLPQLQLQAGKMKEPVGLERLQSARNLLFVERGFPTALVPNRDVGAMLQGDLAGQRLIYRVGVFNGVADGGSTDFQTSDDGMNLATRFFARPFLGSEIHALEGFGVGIAGTYGSLEGPLRSYKSTGQQTMFACYTGTGSNANVLADGQQWRVTPQGYYYWGPFGLFGEYVISSQEVQQAGGGSTAGATGTLVNKAWQVAGSWFLTGERNSWKPVPPKNPLFDGGWGALQVAARVQGIDFDDDAFPVFADPDLSATSAFGWGVGVNWYLNRNLKFTVDYTHTQFDGGDQKPATGSDEQIIMGQLQVSF